MRERCPVCESGQRFETTIGHWGDELVVHCECRDCGAKWREHYEVGEPEETVVTESR